MEPRIASLSRKLEGSARCRPGTYVSGSSYRSYDLIAKYTPVIFVDENVNVAFNLENGIIVHPSRFFVTL